MGWVGAAISAYGAYQNYANAKKMARNAPTINYADALKQSSDQYGPMYDAKKSLALQSLQNNAVKRGVYGQLPTDVYQGKVGSAYDAQKASALASLAQDLVSGSQSRNDAAQNALSNAQGNYYNTLGSTIGSLGSAASSSLSKYVSTNKWTKWLRPTNLDTTTSSNYNPSPMLLDSLRRLNSYQGSY